MLNGTFQHPTVVLFGKDAELRVGEEIAKHSKRVLLHFGGGSIKHYGLYDRVVKSLNDAGISYVELGGVRPNPRADLVYQGIDLCRKENIDFVLAVGGGSVIDSAKAIALGVPYDGDFFELFEQKGLARGALKIGTILTVPGAGSETSPTAVITSDERGLKLSYTHASILPTFSILNPAITCTLPPYLTCCGIVDAISHVFERYFTNTTYVDCTDRICEGLIKTLMKYAFLVQGDPSDYDVRAEIMWACKLAHDDTAGFGRKQDWSSHVIAHELGALFDVAHGAALAVIFPAWMRYVSKISVDRFVQAAVRIFDADPRGATQEEIALWGIDAYQEFLKKMKMPTTLRALGVADKKMFGDISTRCVRFMKSGTIGNFVRLAPSDIVQILNLAF